MRAIKELNNYYLDNSYRMIIFIFLICFGGKAISGAPSKDALEQGIHFEQGLNWEQLKEKARIEHKYIFIDCYASWCNPCKAMDHEVFLDSMVGTHVNENFVSSRLQMDTTGQDNEQVVKVRQLAHEFEIRYSVTAFPTFLFFNADGEIVHEGVGFKDSKAFLGLTEDATNDNKQFFTLLRKYQSQAKNYSDMPYLAREAKENHLDSLAISIAQDYMTNYLFKQDRAEVLTKDRIHFIGTFSKGTGGEGFRLFYKNGDAVDSVMGKGYSQAEADYLIGKYEIDPILRMYSDKNDANWAFIERKIKREYGKDYAERTILNAKVPWYRMKRQWHNYVKYFILQTEGRDIDTSSYLNDMILNNVIWEVIFLHSDDKKQLAVGLKWVEGILRRHPNAAIMDTYANLLYKAGDKTEAIHFEEKALQETPTDKESFANTISKMKSGLPTWNR